MFSRDALGMLQTMTLKLVTVHFQNTELFREGREISLQPKRCPANASDVLT